MPVRAPRFSLLIALALALAGVPVFAASGAAPEPLPGVAQRTAGLDRRPGLLNLYVDRQRGHVYLEVPPPDAAGECGRFLYIEGLVQGMGSNPVGLDRGQIGPTRVVVLRRVGGRVLMEQPNYAFRALSASPAEQNAVRESFATSILWGGELVALDPDGRALVDFTSFLVRDAHQVIGALHRAGQGSYELDESRSAVDLPSVLAFPDNLEFEAVLTYTGRQPGAEMREHVPTPSAMTLVEHQSIVRLPEGYTPRRFDPRSGSFGVGFADYAAPLAQPLETQYLVRFRLEKTDPTAARSPVKKPIVYYVDPGTPEPIRSALIEGASWWAKAFDAAGFIDAFRVELLPPGANPLDVRYNVIQWVHRSTRGWSYGGGVTDPRTGEMLKGHVTLDSLRIRQDRRIFEGLVGTDHVGDGSANDPLRVALARIRQLAAHEVGHTLGLAHNFASSTYGRASVMDYPAPLVKIDPRGELDLSQAYATGVGEWDVQAIRYAYSQFAPGADDAQALAAILEDGRRHGRIFLSDQDARGDGDADPRANLWDNGDDPAAELAHELQVRAIALGHFGEANVAPGRPLASLDEVLAPLYFHHRYALQAAAKAVGGFEYSYALRGDGQGPGHVVAPDLQRRALAAALLTLDPAALDLPDSVLALLLPRVFEQPEDREQFAHQTAPVFDALGAAQTMAGMTVDLLLQPQRAARLVDFHRRDPRNPGLEDVLGALTAKAFDGPPPTAERQVEIRRAVQEAVVLGMIQLSDASAAPGRVRERVEAQLVALRRRLEASGGDGADAAHRRYLAREIAQHFAAQPAPATLAPPPLAPPPGDPIGAWAEGDCGFAWGGR